MKRDGKPALGEEILRKLTVREDLTTMSYAELVDDFRSMPNLEEFKPTNICKVDPRNGDRVIYSPMRARRPTELKPRRHVTVRLERIHCPVCEGETTGIIDVAPLSDGYTFINKNMFPVVSYDFPGDRQPVTYEPAVEKRKLLGTYSQGGHWLQWFSNRHHVDLHNMPVEDIEVVLSRLAAFEGFLLSAKESNMPAWTDPSGKRNYGFVGIIRNYGSLGGASLAHGHMQITHTNIIPRAILDDRDFLAENGRTFAEFMTSENPSYLNIREFTGGLRLMVPYFMKRPFAAVMAFADCEACSLHQLDAERLKGLAEGLHAVTRALKVILEERLERSFSYNLVFHNGPSGCLYVEVLPHSQEWGGFEHMGWFICQATPAQAADGYREAFEELGI